jgi:hypothetical protein
MQWTYVNGAGASECVGFPLPVTVPLLLSNHSSVIRRKDSVLVGGCNFAKMKFQLTTRMKQVRKLLQDVVLLDLLLCYHLQV